MGAMWLPTMAGVARMVPIRDKDTPLDVGAGWSVDAFIVPAGRVLAIDWARLTVVSGTLPSTLRFDLIGAGSGGDAQTHRETAAALNASIFLTNTVWLEEAGRLRISITGGGATTDMQWSFAGRLFDWQDVT